MRGSKKTLAIEISPLDMISWNIPTYIVIAPRLD